jgi:hypothetical protein
MRSSSTPISRKPSRLNLVMSSMGGGRMEDDVDPKNVFSKMSPEEQRRNRLITVIGVASLLVFAVMVMPQGWYKPDSGTVRSFPTST